MQAKIHIAPDGPKKCQDQSGRCPYKHFLASQKDEAWQYYESHMEDTFGVPSLSSSGTVAYGRSSEEKRLWRIKKIDKDISSVCKYGLLAYVKG